MLLQSVQWSTLEKIHCLALQTAAVTSTVVLVFYWSVNPEAAIWGPYPDGYLKYAANAPIMLLDVWFSKVPFASYHLQVSDYPSHLQILPVSYLESQLFSRCYAVVSCFCTFGDCLCARGACKGQAVVTRLYMGTRMRAFAHAWALILSSLQRPSLLPLNNPPLPSFIKDTPSSIAALCSHGVEVASMLQPRLHQ